jgi:hypothetical protein
LNSSIAKRAGRGARMGIVLHASLRLLSAKAA